MGTIYRRGDTGGSASKWYAEFTDHTGKRIKKSTGTRHRKTALQILAQWENEVALKKAGLIDPQLERISKQATREITEHFEEWIQSLAAKGRPEQYQQRIRGRWDRIVESTGWQRLADVSPEDLERFCADLRQSGRYKNSAKRSSQTIGQYIQTAKGFTKWAMETKRIQYNPLLTIKKPNPETDRRLRRRMLLPDEWPHLRNVAASCSRYGVSSVDRALLYELAIETGLRSDELRSLCVHNVRLEAVPSVTLRADQTKNGIAARQFITGAMASKLKSFIKQAKRKTSEQLFTLCSESNMARMIRADMHAAREAWIEEATDEDDQKQRESTDFLCVNNHDGAAIDFHALRHTCGAWLAIQGVHPKTIQSVMRHSTITLTLDSYGHLMPGAQASAVDEIGKLLR